jgi:two-component system, OmpR family, KDP operon response regulator KdpE
MVPGRVLVLHELEHPRDSVAELIQKEGCEVITARIESAANSPYIHGCAVIIFEVSNVTHRILELCSSVRAANASATLLIVGNPVAESKRIAALVAGSDAYLAKPVLVAELQARLRTALRRAGGGRGTNHRRAAIGGRIINFDARTVTLRGQSLRLTPIEWNLLESLVLNVNHTVPGEELVRRIWGQNSEKGVHSLRVFIKSLRNKLEPDPRNPKYILTEPSLGYRLQIPFPRRSDQHAEGPR